MAELATFAGGCFWCMEAVFQNLRGVEQVVSGYLGGRTPNPSYEMVCSGLTGHAEAIQISFDPAAISYHDLLELFFAFHDPTTLNRQGPDEGDPVPLRDLLSLTRPEDGGGAGHSGAERSGDLRRPHRHRAQPGGEILPRRAIPSGLLPAESRQGVLPGDDHPESGQAQDQVRQAPRGRHSLMH